MINSHITKRKRISFSSLLADPDKMGDQQNVKGGKARQGPGPEN